MLPAIRNSNYLRFVFLSLIFLVFSWSNSYGGVVHLSRIKENVVINFEDYTVFEDTTKTITLANYLKGQYKRLEEPLSYYRNLNANYVLSINLYNDTKQEGKWVLEFLDPHTSIVEFYQVGKGRSYKQGFLLPFDHKLYQHKNHVFDVYVPPGDTAQCLVFMESKNHVGFISKIYTNSDFARYSLNEYVILGVFYGFLVIMALYNIILYFFTKMRTRIYYSFYVVSCILSTFAEDGLGFQYFWPNFPFINTWLASFQPVIYLVFYVIYSLSFLDVNQKAKDFKRQIVFVVLGYSLFHLISVYFNFSAKIWIPFYFIPFAIIWNYSFKKFREGEKMMRFLLLGSSLIILSYFIFLLRVHGIVGNSIFMIYFFNFTVTIEIILFSIAVGDKLRAIQNENLDNKERIIQSLKENEELSNKVNRELEEKVNERTMDLIAAKQKLEKQAQEITQMNLQLDLHNRSLSKKVVEVSKKRVHSEAIDPEEFHEMYPNKLECYKLLEDIKWKNGFKCRKCTNPTFMDGLTFRSRRCTKCGTNESPTAGTIFHGLRIPIEKSFYIFALVVQAKGEITSVELEEKTGVNQKASWSFKQKIVAKIKEQKGNIKAWDQLIF
jgi:hypothetical protein